VGVLDYIKYVNDKGYVVKREMPRHQFVKDNQIRMDWLAAFRDYLNCDHVLQTDRNFLFCQTIQDVTIIEENEN
tara:strand:+ start:351 stop:572 length:222 start_codon:yes stop_codon:yes gene_type:complete